MLQFALPIFLGTIFQSFYVTVDAIIIGQFAGKEALSAIEAITWFNKNASCLLIDYQQSNYNNCSICWEKEFDKVSEAQITQ